MVNIKHLEGIFGLMTRDELKEKIDKAKFAYYNTDNPIISDKEYDNLIKRYGEEPSVGAPVLDSIKKITIADKPMLSLDKVHNEKEIISFSNGYDIVASIKCDGLSVRLIYKNGILFSANTRGNGNEGADITEHIKYFTNVPLKILKTEKYIIDGEAIIYNDDFKIINKNNQFKNSRNTASGSLASLDMNIVKQRHLSFIAWDVIQGGCSSEYYHYNMEEAENLGFTTVPMLILDATKVEQKEIANINQTLLKESKEKGIPCDGVVWRINDTKEGNRRGQTAHHFLNAIAWKPNDEEYKTELLDITYDVSRRGILTPVAIFTPINIDDTVVSKASLHNLSVMHETLGLYPEYKQKIWVSKMNMIIPQIVRAEKNDIPHDHIIQEQTCCPICGGPLEVRRDGIADILYCTNPNCSRKIINQLDFALGKKALDIKGLSKATLEKLIDWNWINSFSDIFELKDHRLEWARKTGFGIKSVDKILNSIAVSSHTTLDKVIAACMIPNIGATASKDLAKYFKTWDNFRKSITDNFDFTSLPNMGSVADYDIKHHDYSEMDMIVNRYLTIEKESKEGTDNNTILNDKIFVITGKLSVTRDKLKAELEEAGAKVTGSVSTKTDYLIANAPENTTKYKKAKILNIPIISEAQVRIMLQS